MTPTARASLLALAALLLASRPGVAAEEKSPVKLVQQDNRVHVEMGGKPFTDYYFAAEEGRPYVRPYFYPVLAADGTEVTSDQTRAKAANPKEDHPHHRSLWVSHGSVNGVDHWAIVGANPPKQRHVKFDKVEGDTIVQELAWEGKDGQPILNETRTIHFRAYGDGSRGIDITSEYKAADKPVQFGDTKEAGLCSVRVAKSIADNPVLTLSTGATSKQNEDKAKKIKSDEANVWGKEADWCDISGQINGKTYGLAILDHPGNPLQAKWHARRYGLVGANNIGASEFNKKDPHVYTPFGIEPGKPATFKFRVIVHAGGAEEAKVAEKYTEFAR
jgi:hypothetical protein